MAKKPRPILTEPNPSVVPSRDVMNRLNFLYQASILFASSGSTASRSTGARRNGKGEGAERGGVDGELQGGRDGGKGFLIPTLVVREDPEELEEGAKVEPVAGPSVEISAKETTLKPAKSKKRRSSNNKDSSALPALSRMMVQTLKDVSTKGTVRMDPTLKRTLCKHCSTPLIPGLTSQVRIKPSGPHAHRVSHTCTQCWTTRHLPAPPHLDPPLQIPVPTVLESSAIPMIGDVVVEAAASVSSGDAGRTKRERRELKQRRKPVFFEREGHVTFAGETMMK